MNWRERAEKSTKNGFMRMMYPLGTQASSAQDKVFETQKNIMQFFAERESCIIVGRCSDFIFADRPDSMHIYIYAPYNARVKNCIQDLKLEEQEAKKMIRSVDEAREQLPPALCRIPPGGSAIQKYNDRQQYVRYGRDGGFPCRCCKKAVLWGRLTKKICFESEILLFGRHILSGGTL